MYHPLGGKGDFHDLHRRLLETYCVYLSRLLQSRYPQRNDYRSKDKKQSDTLKKQPFFPVFVVQLVHVREETDELARIYDEIVFHLEQRIKVRAEIKNNMFTVKFFLVLAVFAVILAIFVYYLSLNFE